MILPASLQNIVDDNLSGSVSLLNRFIVALENELLNPELDPATFISYIEYFRHKMEMFTLIRHFCDELILTHNISVSHYPANYLEFINDYKEFWEHIPQLLLKNLMNTIELQDKSIMVHSNSGTIREVFKLLSQQHTSIHFYQTLSAPAEEGRVQAHDLAQMGFKVTLIPDVLAAEKMKLSDYLILAADQIRAKTIVNKVGSHAMAMLAQEFNVPVIVLSESRKLNHLKKNAPFKDKNRDSKEILDKIIHPNLHAENIYFEEIPRHLISKIITEKGVVNLK